MSYCRERVKKKTSKQNKNNRLSNIQKVSGEE